MPELDPSELDALLGGDKSTFSTIKPDQYVRHYLDQYCRGIRNTITPRFREGDFDRVFKLEFNAGAFDPGFLRRDGEEII